MRLFIAVNLEDRVRSMLSRKVDIIKDEITEDLKWVESVNWHLTLKFLGEINSDQLKIIKNVMERSIGDRHRFSLQFSGVDAFPQLNYPRVIYIGVREGEKTLSGFYSNLEEGLAVNGIIKKEDSGKDYIPHLTLARARRRTKPKQVFKRLKKFSDDDFFVNIYMNVDRISLMKSELNPDGPVYEEIFSVFLK